MNNPAGDLAKFPVHQPTRTACTEHRAQIVDQLERFFLRLDDNVAGEAWFLTTFAVSNNFRAILTGSQEAPLVELCCVDVITKAVTFADQQIPEDPSWVGCPLRCSKRAVPSACINQTTVLWVDGCIVWDAYFDAANFVSTRRDTAELLCV